MNDFVHGVRKGIPIALGYLSVSFTFGIMAVNGGLPIWVAVLISLSNLTSAGQFAGTTLMIAGGSYFEIALSTLVINIRYMLMSLALSQKLKQGTKRSECFRFGYGITDEVFAVAASESGKISAKYMYGLISLPVVGWTFGTLLGAIASDVLPVFVSNAMSLGLYAMFIAIIVPPSKKEKSILIVVLLAVLIECLLFYLPVFQIISGGFKVIIATILAAGVGALLFPVRQGEDKNDETID